MRQQTVQRISEQEVLVKTIRSALLNALWFGVGAVAIALISNVSWKIAVGLFVAYLIVYLFAIGIDALQILTTVLLPGLLAIPLAMLYGRVATGRMALTLLGAVTRIIDVGAGLAFGW